MVITNTFLGQSANNLFSKCNKVSLGLSVYLVVEYYGRQDDFYPDVPHDTCSFTRNGRRKDGPYGKAKNKLIMFSFSFLLLKCR